MRLFTHTREMGTGQAHTSEHLCKKLHFVNTRTASNRGRYCSTGKQRRGIAH